MDEVTLILIILFASFVGVSAITFLMNRTATD